MDHESLSKYFSFNAFAVVTVIDDGNYFSIDLTLSIKNNINENNIPTIKFLIRFSEIVSMV